MSLLLTLNIFSNQSSAANIVQSLAGFYMIWTSAIKELIATNVKQYHASSFIHVFEAKCNQLCLNTLQIQCLNTI